MGFFSNTAMGFSMPEPVNGIMCEALVLNVLRSLQFSYMLMKGFQSTTRALRDLDVFRDEGRGGTSGRLRWRSTGSSGGGGVGRIGTGTGRGGLGRCSIGSSTRSGVRIIRVPGHRFRCTGNNLGTRARAEGDLQGKVGGNGASTGNDERKVSEGTQGGKGDSKNGPLNTAGDPAEAVIPEGSTRSGMGVGTFRVPAASVLVTKVQSGLTNRTVFLAQLGSVDSISSQIKSMTGSMKGIKMATRIVSGVKAAHGVIEKFQTPAGGVLLGFGAANGVVLGFETAKVIVKGAKISKDFARVGKHVIKWFGVKQVAGTGAAGLRVVKQRLSKGLKVSDGALTFVTLTKDFGTGLGDCLPDGLTHWDLMNKGYVVSRGAMKVFETFLGSRTEGVIGLVGKGFTVVKGAVGGLGLSVKVVKAVTICKKASIALFHGFGLSKTIADAFKAIQDGNKMVHWITFRRGSQETAVDDMLQVRRLVSPNGGTDPRTFELLMTCAKQSAACTQDTASSLMYSLAALLIERCEDSDASDIDEVWFTYSNVSPCGIFLLSVPS